VGAVRAPDLGKSESRDTGGTELGLGMDYRDLLFGGHTRKGVFHPLLLGKGRIEICRSVESDVTGNIPSAGSGQKRYGTKEEKSCFHQK
jgi:hypothetical protein